MAKDVTETEHKWPHVAVNYPIHGGLKKERTKPLSNKRWSGKKKEEKELCAFFERKREGGT